jgi:hypothetical protein
VYLYISGLIGGLRPAPLPPKGAAEWIETTKEKNMKILYNTNGLLLVEEDGPELEWYAEQGYNWEDANDLHPVSQCGDDLLYHDVVLIYGDPEGITVVKLEYSKRNRDTITRIIVFNNREVVTDIVE